MNIEDDPKLTAYILGELDADDVSLLESQLSGNEGAQTAIREAKEYASMIRDAYKTEPVYRMTSKQREDLLLDSDIVAVTETLPDKVLSFSEGAKVFEKERTESKEINIGKRSFPMAASFSAAALVIGLAVVLLKHDQIESGSKSEIVHKPADPFSITVVDSDTVNGINSGKLNWIRRQIAADPVKFPVTYRYGQPKPLDEISDGLVFLDGESFRNPAMEGQRWSIFPSTVSSKSRDLLRKFMMAGDL